MGLISYGYEDRKSVWSALRVDARQAQLFPQVRDILQGLFGPPGLGLRP